MSYAWGATPLAGVINDLKPCEAIKACVHAGANGIEDSCVMESFKVMPSA